MNFDVEGFTRWLKRRRRSPDTIATYVGQLKQIEDPIDRLTDPSLAPKTLHVARAALRAWAKFTQNAALLAEIDEVTLPAAQRQAPRVPFSRTDWTRLEAAVQQDRLLDAAERASLGIVVSRGLRVSDVLRMTPEQVAMAISDGELTIRTKGDRRVTFDAQPIVAHLAILADFDGWETVGDLVAPRAKNARHAARLKLWRHLQRIAKRLGVKNVYPHRFRRTVAVTFLESSGDLGLLQDFMGWASVATAQGYTDHGRRAEASAVWNKVRGKRVTT